MNRNYLKLAAALLLTFLMTGSLLAQQQERQHRRGMPSPEERVERMVEQYSLSEDQAAQLTRVFEEGKANRPQVRGMSREEARPEICRFILHTHDQVMGILSAEQGEQYEQDMQERARGRGMNPAACEEFRNG